MKEHSKVNCIKIVKWVAGSQQRFDELFELFLHDEYHVVQRAGWPVSYCVMAHPRFITKHFSALLKNLQRPGLHNAVKRNSIRLLQNIPIPKKYRGAVMDTCFRYLESPTEPVAVKVFSMIVLGNLAKEYPAIIPEIKLLVEQQLTGQTAGFKSRAHKLLKSFETAVAKN